MVERDGPGPGAGRRGRDRRGADDPATAALLAEARRGFRPNQVIAVATEPGASAIPLLEDRVAIGGRPTAYVCRGFVCRLPVTDAAALRDQLDAAATEPAGAGGGGA